MKSQFTLPVEITIRQCKYEDLIGLEWFGLFTSHRKIIQNTFAQQQNGDALMLIALANETPVAQGWIDLAQKRKEKAGIIWAMRTTPPLQGLGIGTKIIQTCEQILLQLGYLYAELGVEKTNSRAKNLYEKLGYGMSGSSIGLLEVETPGGGTTQIPVYQWVLRKSLEKKCENLRKSA